MREFVLFSGAGGKVLNIAAVVLVLTFTGPFGTYSEFALGYRLLFWTVAILGGGLFIHASVYALLSFKQTSVPKRLFAIAVGVAVGAVPSSAVVMTAYSYLSGDQFPASLYPLIWSNVALIGFGVSLVQFRAELRGPAAPTDPVPAPAVEAPAKTPPKPVPLLDRLPAKFAKAQILSFSMQDHYVEVSTDQGKHMILMRFADAMDLLGGLSGVRTHRSHWAATEALVGLKKSGRKHFALLTNGSQLPVSGTYLEEVKQTLEEKSAA